MSRRLVINLIALAIGIGIGVYFSVKTESDRPEQARSLPSPHAGALDQLPDFSLPDLDGTSQASSRWAGKVLVLNFWATWCPPCLREMPGFMELQSELGAEGLQFVGIAIDSPETVRQFAAERDVNYPILIGGENAVQLSRQLGNRFEGLPFSVIIDRRGGVVYSQAGELKQEVIREKVADLL